MYVFINKKLLFWGLAAPDPLGTIAHSILYTPWSPMFNIQLKIAVHFYTQYAICTLEVFAIGIPGKYTTQNSTPTMNCAVHAHMDYECYDCVTLCPLYSGCGRMLCLLRAAVGCRLTNYWILHAMKLSCYAENVAFT